MTLRDRTLRRIAPLLPFLLALAIHGRTAAFSFVTLDDPAYVRDNPVVLRGLSADGVASVLSGKYTLDGCLHPLTMLSHMAAVELFGPSPAGHHAVNVLLHGANGTLLYLLLLALTGAPGRCLLAASLFVAHPLSVESVAWVSERKGLLCALFTLLSMRSWAAWARSGMAGAYALSLAAFALSLLAKPAFVALPLALLLLDRWPLRRLEGFSPPPREDGAEGTPAVPLRKAILEKVPFLLLSACASAATVWLHRVAVADQSASLPLALRLGNVLLSLARYLGKFLFPAGLSPLYSHPAEWPGGLPAAWTAGSALLAAALALLAWRERDRRPHLAFGLAFAVLALLPVLGFIQVGFGGMADRYAYVPLWGLLVAVVWEGAALAGRLRPSPAARKGIAAACAALVALLSALSFAQAGHWRDGDAFYRRALAIEPGNATALAMEGNRVSLEGRATEALPLLYKALRVRPRYSEAWFHLGAALDGVGRTEEATAAFRRALEIRPDPAAWRDFGERNLGVMLVRIGRRAEAVAPLRAVVEQDPADTDAWTILGNALYGLGRTEEGLEAWRRAVQADPRNRHAWFNLSGASFAAGRRGEGVAAREALRAVDPAMAENLPR